MKVPRKKKKKSTRTTKKDNNNIEELKQHCHFCRNDNNKEVIHKICINCTAFFTEEIESLKLIKDEILAEKKILDNLRRSKEKVTKEYETKWFELKNVNDYIKYSKMKPIYDRDLENSRKDNRNLDRKRDKLISQISRYEYNLRRYSSLAMSKQIFIRIRTHESKHEIQCDLCKKPVSKNDSIRYFEDDQRKTWVHQHLSCLFNFIVENGYPLFFVGERRANYYQHFITDYLEDFKFVIKKLYGSKK
jgi:hypothetical protein